MCLLLKVEEDDLCLSSWNEEEVLLIFLACISPLILFSWVLFQSLLNPLNPVRHSVLKGLNASLYADLGDIITRTNIAPVIFFKDQKSICKSLMWPNRDDFTAEY